MEEMIKLACTFKEHGIRARAQHEEVLNRWKNEHSSDDVPDYMKDDFCLPEELCRMVEWMMELKAENQKLRNDIIAMENHLMRGMFMLTGSQVDKEKVSEQEEK